MQNPPPTTRQGVYPPAADRTILYAGGFPMLRTVLASGLAVMLAGCDVAAGLFSSLMTIGLIILVGGILWGIGAALWGKLTGRKSKE